MQWSDEDKEFTGPEKRIEEAWGLDRGVINELLQKPKSCRVESPMSWCPPPSLVLKVNFDGAARGNAGDVGYGGVCRNCNGEIIQAFYSSLETDTNNSAELEGMIQGIQIIIGNGWLPMIV